MLSPLSQTWSLSPPPFSFPFQFHSEIPNRHELFLWPFGFDFSLKPKGESGQMTPPSKSSSNHPNSNSLNFNFISGSTFKSNYFLNPQPTATPTVSTIYSSQKEIWRSGGAGAGAIKKKREMHWWEGDGIVAKNLPFCSFYFSFLIGNFSIPTFGIVLPHVTHVCIKKE